MNQLKEMLEAYRNGERGLPTYAELAALLDLQSAVVQALHDLEVSANTVRYCYEKRPENFASALLTLSADAESAREAVRSA